MKISLEKIAKRTWQRTALGWIYDCHQGEETFTDINLLDLTILNSHHHIIKTSKNKEPETGTDWEWIIRHNGSWRRFAIQAKKVSKNGKYEAINHKVITPSWLSIPLHTIGQADILELYARATSAIPIYVLFNFDNSPLQNRHWHCFLGYDSEQLGCTVTDLSRIRLAINTRGRRTFDAIHANGAIPWRCLVCDCPSRPQVIKDITSDDMSLITNDEVEKILKDQESDSIEKIDALNEEQIKIIFSDFIKTEGEQEQSTISESDLIYLKNLLKPKYILISDGDVEEQSSEL